MQTTAWGACRRLRRRSRGPCRARSPRACRRARRPCGSGSSARSRGAARRAESAVRGPPAAGGGVAAGVKLGEEPVGGLLAAPSVPHTILRGAVIGDQREVAVLLLPGHLVDADVKERARAGRDRARRRTRAPRSARPCPSRPAAAGRSRLVGARGQPGDQALEVAREPERWRANGTPSASAPCAGSADAGAGSGSPAATTRDRDAATPSPPAACPCARRRELAARAHKPAAPQHHLDHHPVGPEPDVADPDSLQAQKSGSGSRAGARCRRSRPPVSPARSPNGTCGFHRIRLSTSPSVTPGPCRHGPLCPRVGIFAPR